MIVLNVGCIKMKERLLKDVFRYFHNVCSVFLNYYYSYFICSHHWFAISVYVRLNAEWPYICTYIYSRTPLDYLLLVIVYCSKGCIYFLYFFYSVVNVAMGHDSQRRTNYLFLGSDSCWVFADLYSFNSVLHAYFLNFGRSLFFLF